LFGHDLLHGRWHAWLPEPQRVRKILTCLEARKHRLSLALLYCEPAAVDRTALIRGRAKFAAFRSKSSQHAQQARAGRISSVVERRGSDNADDKEILRSD
jgi:hypothetical protein